MFENGLGSVQGKKCMTAKSQGKFLYHMAGFLCSNVSISHSSDNSFRIGNKIPSSAGEACVIRVRMSW